MNANDNSAAIYLRVNVDISIYVHMLVAEQEAKVDRSAADAIKAQATQQLTSFDVACKIRIVIANKIKKELTTHTHEVIIIEETNYDTLIMETSERCPWVFNDQLKKSFVSSFISFMNRAMQQRVDHLFWT